MRQACEGSYFTPHSCSIRWATRADVHRLVSYPSACGPRFKPRSMRRKSSGRRRGLRPARPAFFSARRPPCWSCRAHWLTDCRCAPTRLATSDWLYPLSSSRAASIRRCSKASKSLRTPAGFPIRAHYHKTPTMSLYYSILNSRASQELKPQRLRCKLDQRHHCPARGGEVPHESRSADLPVAEPNRLRNPSA